MKTKGEKGYIAIASMLVILLVVTIIVTSVSLLSINDIQSALSGKKGNESLFIVEGCVENALIKLNKDNLVPSSIVTPNGTCSVTINSQVGNNWTLTVGSQSNGYTKNVQVTAIRDATITVSSWKEL
jgi:hypothetical protein